jgi:hypothetical protein
MRPPLLSIAAGFVLAVATTVGAQDAVGPVPPRPPRPPATQPTPPAPPVGPVTPSREIDALENTLGSLIKDNAAGKVWKGADAARLSQFMERVEDLTGDIHAIAVGPVTPRPASPPPSKPGATPPPKPPNPKPSQKAFEDSLNGLLDAVQDARRNPAATLPADDARDLRGVIDVLSKGQLR